MGERDDEPHAIDAARGAATFHDSRILRASAVILTGARAMTIKLPKQTLLSVFASEIEGVG